MEKPGESTDSPELDIYLPGMPDLQATARVEETLRWLLRRRGALRRVVRPKY